MFTEYSENVPVFRVKEALKLVNLSYLALKRELWIVWNFFFFAQQTTIYYPQPHVFVYTIITAGHTKTK